eukprot:UN16752
MYTYSYILKEPVTNVMNDTESLEDLDEITKQEEPITDAALNVNRIERIQQMKDESSVENNRRGAMMLTPTSADNMSQELVYNKNTESESPEKENENESVDLQGQNAGAESPQGVESQQGINNSDR